MTEYRTAVMLILVALFIACVSYILSGQYVIALALLIGLFPVVMSLATRKR